MKVKELVLTAYFPNCRRSTLPAKVYKKRCGTREMLYPSAANWPLHFSHKAT